MILFAIQEPQFIIFNLIQFIEKAIIDGEFKRFTVKILKDKCFQNGEW